MAELSRPDRLQDRGHVGQQFAGVRVFQKAVPSGEHFLGRWIASGLLGDDVLRKSVPTVDQGKQSLRGLQRGALLLVLWILFNGSGSMFLFQFPSETR